MRISDWSSDVCSSDLFPSPSCESSGPQVTEPPVEDQRNRQGNHQQDGDDDFHDHGQCHHMPPRFFRVRSIFTAMLLPMRPMRPSTMETPPQRIRSEEHTSELQSLMRISYAVFCLNKKITNKTN